MVRGSLRRGVAAGAVAGLGFGLFLALVGNPLVGYVESLTHAHDHAAGEGHVVPEAVTAAASVAGGVLWGLVLGGVVFGAVYFLVEPALPGTARTGRVLLAAAGFLTVSGAPWLVYPPRPPGVAHAVPVGTRAVWVVATAATAALACGLALLVFRRLRARVGGRLAAVAGLAPFALLAVPPALAPAGGAVGDLSPAVTAAYRAVVVAGQVGLWAGLAAAHGWLAGREHEAAVGPEEPLPAD